MTKGKYTSAAAVRHEVTSRDAEIQTYRHRVASLTAELAAVREKAALERRAAAVTMRELQTRLSFGASPEVEALKLLLAKMRAERDQARRDCRNEIIAEGRTWVAMVKYLASTGMGQASAWDVIESWIHGGPKATVADTQFRTSGRLSSQRLAAFKAARSGTNEQAVLDVVNQGLSE